MSILEAKRRGYTKEKNKIIANFIVKQTYIGAAKHSQIIWKDNRVIIWERTANVSIGNYFNKYAKEGKSFAQRIYLI